MNWGVRIAVLYIGFIALIITMVSMTMRERVDLVSSDYYQKEINYQQRIDEIRRAKELGDDQLRWQIGKGGIVLDFPQRFRNADITAEVTLFRPSDASLDKKQHIEHIAGGTQFFATRGVKAGYYKIQVFWEVGGTTFYNEGFIQIP